ncbi:hypothetical protein E2C01_055077 [Portunus trituberculatus]|uniref:Uncharacterized protein n=1 Tax=Portunus trituberculatus TaxID=210409 RepID=A0A5B7GUB9_PORTR|nr:hypothetical protein [Portunus trituberculatus]
MDGCSLAVKLWLVWSRHTSKASVYHTEAEEASQTQLTRPLKAAQNDHTLESGPSAKEGTDEAVLPRRLSPPLCLVLSTGVEPEAARLVSTPLSK